MPCFLKSKTMQISNTKKKRQPCHITDTLTQHWENKRKGRNTKTDYELERSINWECHRGGAQWIGQWLGLIMVVVMVATSTITTTEGKRRRRKTWRWCGVSLATNTTNPKTLEAAKSASARPTRKRRDSCSRSKNSNRRFPSSLFPLPSMLLPPPISSFFPPPMTPSLPLFPLTGPFWSVIPTLSTPVSFLSFFLLLK